VKKLDDLDALTVKLGQLVTLLGATLDRLDKLVEKLDDEKPKKRQQGDPG
jgi:hypothetical protein